MKYRKLKKKIKKDKYFEWNIYSTQHMSKKERAKFWKTKFILRAAYARRDRLYEKEKRKMRYQRWVLSLYNTPIFALNKFLILQF